MPLTPELALLHTVHRRCGHWPHCQHTAIGLDADAADQALDNHYRQAHRDDPHPHPGLAAYRRHQAGQR